MAKASDHRPWAGTRKGLADQLGQIDGVLPGSVVLRHMPCGKPGCACKADPPELHGPYIQWTRTVEGKTVTRYLRPEQLERYQTWFDNARRVKELIAKLEIASVHALQSEDRQARTTSTPPTSRRSPPRRSNTKP